MNPFNIIEKYYSQKSELFRILMTHSNQVKEKTLIIANNHPELKLDIQFLEEATLLHDIGIFLCHAPAIQCVGTHQYIEHGYLGADLLRKEGLEKHALVCERHTGVGLSMEIIQQNCLPLPERDMIPVTMEEKLICYADKFYSKSRLEKPHSVENIRTYLNQYGNENVQIFNEWHNLFEG